MPTPRSRTGLARATMLTASVLAVATWLPSAAAKSRPAPADAPTATTDRDFRADDAAFAFVAGVGVVRVSDAGVENVFQTGASLRDLRVAADGALWLSLDNAGVIRVDRGRATTLAPESFAQLAVLAPSDVWTINDGHGSVVHYDGRRWKTVRTRNSLPGAFDDNRLVDIVSDERSVWISGWNGLWRVTRGRWNRIEAPAETAATMPAGEAAPIFPLALVANSAQLVACYPSGCFVANDGGWRRTLWPVERARLRAVSANGALAGIAADGRSVVVADSAAVATSEPISDRGIHDLAVGADGRIWVASDTGLTVLDAKARILERWSAAASDGSATGVERVVVTGKGPAHLPRP